MVFARAQQLIKPHRGERLRLGLHSLYILPTRFGLLWLAGCGLLLLVAIQSQRNGPLLLSCLMLGLWLPRLLKGLEWVEQRIAEEPDRVPIAVEQKGSMLVDGIRIKGRADRIDRLPDGTLAIVDYKTGKAPSAAQVKQGFSLQLGLIGMIAEDGGFAGVAGNASRFEYWSLAKDGGSFGKVSSPVKTNFNRADTPADAFLPLTEDFLSDAIGQFIKGEHPFTARLNPDYAGYDDYDQLMRLDEWQARVDAGDAA